MGVKVGAALRAALDHDEVTLERRIIGGLQDRSGANCDQRCAAGRGHVEAFVDPPAGTWGPEPADEATYAVGAVNREGVAVESRAGERAQSAAGRSDPNPVAAGTDQSPAAVEAVPGAPVPATGAQRPGE